MTNTKKAILGVLAGVMILGATGCGQISGFFTSSSRCAVEERITDSQGDIYDVVKTVTTVNGNTKEFIKGAPCEITNKIGQAITGLYIVNSSDDGWGNNLLEKGEDSSIEDGKRLCGVTLSYNPDETFDIKIDRADGESAEFSDCSLKNLNDPMHMELEFTTNADGTNNIHIF